MKTAGYLVVVLLVLAAGLRAQKDRHSVPDRKAVAEARKHYEKRAAAEADLEKRVALLLSMGLEDGAHPPLRYALLSDAVDLAMQAGTFDLGVRAAGELADFFAVDRADVVRDFVLGFSKKNRTPRWGARAAGVLIETAGRVLAEGDARMAKKLLDDAEAQAKRYKHGGIIRRVKALEKLVAEIDRIESRAAKAGEEAEPLDLALLHLVRGADAVSAALELERCADEKLKALGAAEGARPTRAEGMLDLADLWWQAAAEAKGEAVQAAFRARALGLALACVGRVNSELQERLAPWLLRPQYRAFSGRLLLLGEDRKEEADDWALIQIDDFIDRQVIDRKHPNWRLRVPKFPELAFTSGRRYLAHMETSEGDIVLELDPKAGPNHVANFIYLSRLGYYDDLRVHRIIKGFMAQFGCPIGNGRGSPGYQFDGELETSLKHDRTGTLSMANSGPGTDGSQFFVTFTATPHLDGKHTAFGRMISGRATITALEQLGGTDQEGQPASPVTLQSIRILCL